MNHPEVNHTSETQPAEDFQALQNKQILLVVTGGIAAYKAALIIRGIRAAGGQVQVVMTKAARQFVTPLTLATLSGAPVLDELFPTPAPAEPIHLAAAEAADLMVIAPATANFIGKMAHGLADDLPSSLVLGYQGRVLLAPAMNPRMWDNSIVQENISRLKACGVLIIGPEAGAMAGINEPQGLGRMSEPPDIVNRLEELVHQRIRWQGLKVLVTSGPTREKLDPVRFFSNHSSGILGSMIARQARLRGADVTLVRGLGSTAPAPAGVQIINVDSAAEMAEAVQTRFDSSQLLIMAAAVSDWTISNPAAQKIKKHQGSLDLQWTPTEDILSWAGHHRHHQTVIGFALETEAHLAGAKRKLIEKNVNLIVLNDATQHHSSFGGQTTQLTLISPDHDPVKIPLSTKRLAADRLLDEIDHQFLN